MRITLPTVLVLACLLPARRGLAQGVDPRDRRAVKLLFDSWKLPVPPKHLIGNINYVGAAGVSSYLITTPSGHILVDTTFEDTVPLIQKNIEQLGYHLGDIKFILSSHAHADHTGGHALMKRLTGGGGGATIVASAADAHLMETGGDDDFSPYPKEFLKYTPVKADRIIGDGDQISLGGTTLTAHLTPGHTKGATTWTMQVSDDAGHFYQVVFFSSITLVEGTRLLNNPAYPGIVADYEATFKKLKQLPCDIFFAPHGGQFAMSAKFEQLDKGVSPNPLIDPEGFRRTIADAEKSFQDELAAEQATSH